MPIQILENNIINKIAAGEVIERPSSVVKELVENSIDAGAKSITVEIKDGGVSLIRITDNGCGIAKGDVKNAFKRHATSKLTDIDDLETLDTLGFRGEALASIASVSQVEMITKTAHDITGVRIEIHGGQIISEQEIGCADGTTFIMRNLFFNTPARRKFLKKTATESGYISDIMNKLALGHTEIAFKYINNGSTLIQTSGNGDLKTAIFNIYGKDAAQKLIELDYTEGGYRIKGFIGKPELFRANRSYENFFINGRFIKSGLISSAVEEGYKTRTMAGRFPVFVLNLITRPANVDINVHPSKLEARFSNEDEIYNLVLKAVEEALKDKVLIPEVSVNRETKKTFADITKSELYRPEKIQDNIFAAGAKTTKKSDVDADFDASVKETAVKYDSAIEEGMEGENNPVKPSQNINKTDEIKADINSDNRPTPPFFYNYKIIGQLFNTYWIIEQQSEMYIIDQHAAHERILYEDFVSKFKSQSIASQRLITPEAFKLSESEYNIVKENMELLMSFGFDIEEFGENTYAVRSVPNIFNNPSGINFFLDIIGGLSGADTSPGGIYDTKLDAIATISCKAAVKGNDRLSYLEAKNLIDRILKSENPFNCPHGRPTIVKISKYEIEKMFKRVV